MRECCISVIKKGSRVIMEEGKPGGGGRVKKQKKNSLASEALSRAWA